MNRYFISKETILINDEANPAISGNHNCMQIVQRAFISLVVLNLNILLLSQPFGDASAGFRITKLEYYNSNGEKACTYFNYSKDNILNRAYWVLDDKSRSSINLYEYDSKGCLISSFREFSEGLTSYELFSYDSPGNKISERFYRSDSVSGFASYTYSDNRIIQADFKNHKGWLNGTVIYKYDGQKKKESAELMKDGNIICHISYEYDENNNLSKESWDFINKWNQTFIYHYEKMDNIINYYSSPFLKNTAGYRISKENYTFNNEIGGPSYYYYNEEGLMHKKVFVRSDSISTTTFYEYDKEGKLVTSMRNYSDGSVARFEYVYDENSNLVLRTYYKGDTFAGFESYLYNSDGELIKAYIKNLDNWLTGTVNYTASEYGMITGGEFKGENGFDAKISFNYNNEGLLSGIIWEFTFGKFQQYTFEYELIK